MGRTLLFGQVGRMLAASRRAPARHDGQPLTRRALLAACMAGLGGALAPRSALALDAPPSPLLPSVAIIGAGLAGLSCAYRLRQAGVSATVYEATGHTGGRTRSLRDLGP